MDSDEPNSTAKPEPRVGSYRLIQQLGSGGMSSVFRAVHAETGHEVAVKILPRVLAKNPTLLQRFVREAKSAEALEHPNIVSIYDRGVDQGRNYLVLEYVAGGDLHDRVKGQGPLAIPEAVRVIRTVAEGLRYAASKGLIHRDIKPANLLLSPAGLVKIIDLGLALQAESEDERVTRDGTTVGTVDYMSPEQARDSRATSERSDIYSLGCTFYYLLTGSPPFPGGDLADKLSRHCTKPAPDPRKLRPEISEGLAAVVRRMMAKRPEKRYDDYDQLIAALDAAPLEEAAKPAEPLFALIDEDDDDAPPPAALDALIAEDSDEGIPVAPKGKNAPTALDALIAEDSDDSIPARPASPAKGKRPASAPQFESVPLAELAALDDDVPATPKARPARPVEAPRATQEAPLTALLEDESAALMPGRSAASGRRFSDTSTANLVKRYSIIGVTLILLVIGVDQLIKASRESSDPVPKATKEESEPEFVPERPATARPPVAVANTRPLPPPAIKKGVGPTNPAPSTVATAWVEPTDPKPESIAEPSYGPNEAKLVPTWATQPIPDRLGGPLTLVRRIAEPAAGFDKTTLRQALDVIGGANIEIADDGPFFEDDLHLASDSRLIRARPGFRPIICVEEPKLEVVRQQPAVIVLEGKQLILDGLHLVVDVEELPRDQSALFLCRGASLTLRNCTITIMNPRARPFAVVRTDAAQSASRVRLEQTFVRAQAATGFDLAAGTSEVVVSRSVLIEGPAPLVLASGPDASAERRIHIVRSIVASRAPFLDIYATTSGLRPRKITVQALGSTFACVRGANPASLIAAHEGAGGASEVVLWNGVENVFAGWAAWITIGNAHEVKVADLAAARRLWQGTDAKSQEFVEGWADSSSFDQVLPVHLRALATARLAMLTGVASPPPYLHEKTVGSFPRLVVPALAPETTAVTAPVKSALSPAGTARIEMSPPVNPVPKPRTGSSPVAKSPALRAGMAPIPKGPVPPLPPETPEGEFTFDTDDPAWKGDLGLFLNEKALHTSAGKRVKVTVHGRGEHPWTPIRMPDGVSLAIVVDEARVSRGSLSWSAVPSAAGEGLIDVREGDLVLSGVHLSRDGAPRLKALVRVEGGHLVLNRCRLTAPGLVEPGGGNLLAFHAATTRPLTGRAGPFQTPVDRPVCRLIDCLFLTGGDAIAGEVGRGLIALSDCALASGHSAFALAPPAVARSRFEADLWLDHCTVTSERDFFRLGPWKGTAPGPERPWLVTSRNSAYLAYYQGGQRESVLLRSEGGSLAQGALFWEGYNDAYEVTNFTASGESAPLANPRPDVRRQWIGLWGARHVQKATGPGAARPGTPPSVRFVEKLKPGEVAPENLVLDPNVYRDRRKLDVGATPARLGLPVPPIRNERR